jgi:hypothetical protein
MPEIGDHIENITSTLSMFIESGVSKRATQSLPLTVLTGIPTLQFAQQHGTTNLLNLTTVATFFSAVTATTLQYSYNLPQKPPAIIVNSFWFSSLVFSIAAAVNSLLGLTWERAV